MRTPEEKAAVEICYRDGEWRMTGCLKEAKGEVALKGYDDLEYLSIMDTRLLACLCTGEEFSLYRVKLSLNIEDENVLEEMFQRLVEFRFADDSTGVYKATTLGKTVIKKIGIITLEMDCFKFKQGLEYSKSLLARLYD